MKNTKKIKRNRKTLQPVMFGNDMLNEIIATDPIEEKMTNLERLDSIAVSILVAEHQIEIANSTEKRETWTAIKKKCEAAHNSIMDTIWSKK